MTDSGPICYIDWTWCQMVVAEQFKEPDLRCEACGKACPGHYWLHVDEGRRRCPACHESLRS